MGNALPLPMVAVVGSSYVATSLYLLLNPLARYKASPRMKQVPLIAHRGGAGEGYENTILAFRRAVESGAGMLELDVHLTRDGEKTASQLLSVSSLLSLVFQARWWWLTICSFSGWLVWTRASGILILHNCHALNHPSL